MHDTPLRNNLKIFRAKHNMSQAELAEKIGVTRKTIHTIETGKFVPSTVLALTLAKFFQVPVEELFYLDNVD